MFDPDSQHCTFVHTVFTVVQDCGRWSFLYFIKHCFICRLSDSTVSEDAGIEPRTVATLVLAVRRSNHSARSHPHSMRSRPRCQWPYIYECIIFICITFTTKSASVSSMNEIIIYLQLLKMVFPRYSYDQNTYVQQQMTSRGGKCWFLYINKKTLVRSNKIRHHKVPLKKIFEALLPSQAIYLG